MRKTVSTITIIMLLLVFTAVATIKAQSIAKPSAPEFNVKFEAYPYDVQPTYSTDPYSGKRELIQESYRNENLTIIITIKNQPYFYSVNGSKCWLVYNVAVKGHFGDDWNEYYYTSTPQGSVQVISDSENTVMQIPGKNYPSGSQIDFQVQAVSEYHGTVRVYDHIMDRVGHLEPGIVVAERSDWSEIRTIAIPESSPSPTTSMSPIPIVTQTPIVSPSPTQPNTLTPSSNASLSPGQSNSQGVSQAEFYLTIVVFAIAVGALSIAVAVLAGKVKKAQMGNK